VERAAVGDDAKHRKMPWGIFEGKIHMTVDFDEPLEEFKDYM
jgi:hypothetical protein